MMRKMISVDDARSLISEHCMGLGAERVELLAGLGGVLCDDVFSAIDMPGFGQIKPFVFLLGLRCLKGWIQW